MLFQHKQFLPSFSLCREDQQPVCIYTVLSVNESVRDCAAYRGVGPTHGHPDAKSDELLERIKSGGVKISEQEARDLFDEIETMGLRYRR